MKREKRPQIVGIIQARMSSSRLPGKVLAPLGDSSVLQTIVERMRSSKRLTHIVIATSQAATDDAIATAARSWGIAVYRGSEQDVLDRLYQVARATGADVVVRLTADNPLVDGKFVDWCIQQFASWNPPVDYQVTSPAGGFPYGLSVEVISGPVLAEVWALATEPSDREHVTKYIRERTTQYRTVELRSPEDHADLRWTIDTAEDLQRAQSTFRWLSAHPAVRDWMDIAQHLGAAD